MLAAIRKHDMKVFILAITDANERLDLDEALSQGAVFATLEGAKAFVNGMFNGTTIEWRTEDDLFGADVDDVYFRVREVTLGD